MNKRKKKFRFDISFWVVVSAIAVLAVVSIIMAMSQFQKQKTHAVEIFMEKGETLIQSFEAGLPDIADHQSRAFDIQRLLMVISQQPDIDYMIVTDDRGNILADSDPSMIAQKYGLDLQIGQIAQNKKINWRQSANLQGADTFEVYRGFFPSSLKRSNTSVVKDRDGKFVVYLGFNMDKIEKAAAQDTRNTIILTIFLLLIGSLAIVSLFLVQAYRLTRTSFSRMKIFSETLVKNMPIGLIAIDESGKVISCNEKAQEMLQTFCSSVSGKKIDEILPVNLQVMLKELPAKGGLLERDMDIVTPAGDHQKWEAVAAGLEDDDRASGKILLIRDVTQIRDLEKEVARSRHLKSISSLAAGVAHEIRNPLSSIKGFAVYFKQRLSGDKEDEQTADVMIAETERLNRVISQLIEFARPLELKKENVQFMELVQHTIKLIAGDAGKNNVDVKIHAVENLPEMEVDPDKIKQVLLNIFLNAIEAQKEGGNLTIQFAPSADSLTMIISDAGKGIESTNLSHIYDPYFTSKPAGTGLGLAIVQKIMEAHGGKINVESTVGLGTKVYLHFPLNGNKFIKG